MYPLPPSPSVPGHLSVPEGLDVDCLNGLLKMMGPQANDLLLHAIGDLESVRDGLDTAAADNWPQLRQHSHVLVALAGTLGERRLQALAEALNRDAHAQLATDMSEIGRRLLALTGYLHSRIDR